MDSIYKLVLGIVGNAIAVCLFASPLPTFWKIWKNKSTQDFSGMPYVCTLLNCLLWVLYGLPLVTQHALLIITINVAGCVFEIFYLTLFLSYAPKKPKLKVAKVLAVCLAAYTAVVVLTLTAVPKKSRKTEVGSLCVALAIAMYVSPLSVMRLVIRTRSVQFMPLLLSVCVFLNSTVWTGYGIIAHDIFIMIPNALGMLAGLAQLALHAMYRNSTPRAGVDEFDVKGAALAGSPMHMQVVFHAPTDKVVDGKPTSPGRGHGPGTGPGILKEAKHPGSLPSNGSGLTSDNV